MVPELLGYAFTALSLLLSLFLFLALRRELAERQAKAKATWQELEAAVSRVRAELATLRLELKELNDASGMFVPQAPPKSGINLQKRSHALRLHRRGEPSARIASTVGMPAKEVELLIKIQEMVLSGAAATAPPLTGPQGPGTTK